MSRSFKVAPLPKQPADDSGDRRSTEEVRRRPFVFANRLTLTIDETAELLGIGRTLAYEAARTGRLPTIRIGRRVLVPVAELELLVRSNKPL